MARLRKIKKIKSKADFDRRVGTSAVAADSDEKQTVPCAEPGRRERGKTTIPGGRLLHWPQFRLDPPYLGCLSGMITFKVKKTDRRS